MIQHIPICTSFIAAPRVLFHSFEFFCSNGDDHYPTFLDYCHKLSYLQRALKNSTIPCLPNVFKVAIPHDLSSNEQCVTLERLSSQEETILEESYFPGLPTCSGKCISLFHIGDKHATSTPIPARLN
ncbi:hypothetical protein GOP47_0003558 [Adiantum capillus-veneris]|uniref:Uncharacterized protein n=1 Tax=Adiantum capillus-veneris TaxID=13818 RepID=A0A9D4ZSN4_ADICA|nr:hypothetical protein GOP47_0003558 [Adiantum capillus-veneris]